MRHRRAIRNSGRYRYPLPLVLAGTLWRVALACLLGMSTYQVYRVPDRMVTEVQRTRTALQTEAQKTRTALQMELRDTRTALATEIDKTRKEALDRADRLVTASEGTLSKINDTLGSAQPVLANAASLTAQVDNAARPLLDCKGNGACLPAQTMALVGSARFTMGQIAKATPASAQATVKLQQHAAGIAEDVHKVTRAITAPVPLWKKILWGVTGTAGRLKGWF